MVETSRLFTEPRITALGDDNSCPSKRVSTSTGVSLPAWSSHRSGASWDPISAFNLVGTGKISLVEYR